MIFPTLFSVAAMASSAAATTLFVADYSGNITSISLKESNGNWSLEQTHVTDGCAPNPSWLTIDPSRGVLYCMNEGLATPNGSLASFLINADGSLKLIQNTTTPSAPVSGVIYGEPAGQRAIALAHYTGAVSSWLLNGNGNFTKNQEIFYTLDTPGPDPDGRQATPHEHEAITDPTGQYIVVPDLGADLVRVYSWHIATLKLKELNPLKATPGSGPRHAAFWNPFGTPGGTTYFYLVEELTATISAYSVEYLPSNGGLAFNPLTPANQSTTWLHNLPRRNAPAEIHVSPDNRFLIISNRNETAFTLPNAIGKSDSLSTWHLNPDDGSIAFHQLWPAGGSYPRHFELNAVGNLVAVGLQMSEAVAVLARDVQTGLGGEPIARIPIAGNVTAVVWDEERALGGLGA